MKRNVLVVVLACVLFWPVCSAVGADKESVGQELLAEISAAGGTLPVIIKLDAAAVIESELSSASEVTSQRQRIQTRQQEVLAGLNGTGIEHVKRFRVIPYMALAVDQENLERLLEDDGVLGISKDIPVPPSLAESIPFINADQVHTAGYDGSGMTVAILDTGVRRTHEFLGTAKVVSEACYGTTYAPFGSTPLCPNSQESQTGTGAAINCDTAISGCDHGTHVAGIAAGSGGSLGGGVAPGADIIAIQVFSKFVEPTCTTASPCVLSYTSDQLQALERVYELRNSYNIAAVNMSLGGGSYSNYCDSDSRKEIIDNLRAVGIATVISSGNDFYNGYVGAPGCISSAITVGATLDSADTIANYSNHAEMVDLMAPGSSITSSIASGDTSYGLKSGTSMAAPHVTGAFAVMRSKGYSLTVTEIEQALENTGISVSRSGVIKPRIDLLAAINTVSYSPNPHQNGVFPWPAYLPAIIASTSQSGWGVQNYVCCSAGSTSFNLTQSGTTTHSVLSSCSDNTPTWEGWQTTSGGSKSFTWTITSDGCGSMSGSFSYTLSSGRRYLFYSVWTGSTVEIRVTIYTVSASAATSAEAQVDLPVASVNFVEDNVLEVIPLQAAPSWGSCRQ